MPAHNEAEILSQTLENVLSELQPGDRLIVIADNCTDCTAEIARNYGVEVIERQDSQLRGKGYALDFGLQYLKQQPPSVLIIFDADCSVAPGGLARLALQASQTGRPAQSVYLLAPPPQPSPKDVISSLAFTIKNYVRPLGLKSLRLPCLLSTGVAMPWQTFAQLSLASGNLVEDMQMSLDMAIHGQPAQLCPNAWVTGALPNRASAIQSQRTRWEHGHLQTLINQVPRLLKAALQQRRFDLFTLALELSVPPLSLLVLVCVASLGLSLGLAAFGGISWAPFFLFSFVLGVILSAILIAWARFCRATIPAKALWSVPFYVLWKIPLYVAFLVNPQSEWVRTQRDTPPAERI
jgi:cellulose synthase/poly-beta-1,6-N-acetylglucosamine synthase-like glycosyltransferase